MASGFTRKLLSLIVVVAGVAAAQTPISPTGGAQDKSAQGCDGMMTDLHGNRVPIPKGAKCEPLSQAAQTAPPEGSVQGVPPGLIAEPFKPTPAKAQTPLKTKPSAKSDRPTYMITAHTIVHDDSKNSQFDNYVIVYGSEVLRVQYAESQISTVKPGASKLEQVAPGKNLHRHTRYGSWPQEPDVSQVPHIGVAIRACQMDTKYPDSDGHPVIAIQSVSAPCMSRDGDTLHYSIAPNGGIKMFEYVNFDILEATNNVGVIAAQSAPPRKDIPAIAKAANGAIVSIVMFDKKGDPIGQGSGFVVGTDGVVVTNYHVIAEGSSAVVKLPDGTLYDVDGVLAFDKARDVAVIKAAVQNLRVVTLGNSDRVQVGEEVVAIGNPLSLDSTVSNGIVSAIRTIEEEGGKFLQVTTPISPGSSGGPLFNMMGEVVGITTLKFKGGENLNFAIPVNDAKHLLSNQSSKLQNLPNEIEPAAPSAAPAVTPYAPPDSSMPSWETTVEFMKRMAEPEHHDILPGELTGALLSKCVGRAISVISYEKITGVFVTGDSEKNGFPEYTYSLLGEYNDHDYPRYATFCLNDIDPSSVEATEAGLDGGALSKFWDNHPECGKGPNGMSCMDQYLKTGPKLTWVRFHTTDLKPLVEEGAFQSQQTCPDNENTANAGSCALKPIRTDTVALVIIIFRNKERAQRFITALKFAVESQGGKPDMFPPTR